MIILAGGSWAAGEWHNLKLTHGGIGEYLIDDGHSVINLSTPGGHNNDTFTKLKHFLQTNPLLVDDVSHIFLFQTCWTQDLQNYALRTELGVTEFSLAAEEIFLSHFYKNLNQLGEQYNKTFNLIGGIADVLVTEEFAEQYPNVNVFCQSSVNLILNGNPNTSQPVTLINPGFFQDLYHYRETGKGQEELLRVMDLAASRFAIMESNPDYFWPDYYHGNRLFHKKLFEFVKQECKL